MPERKRVVAPCAKDPAWAAGRPPLTPLTTEQAAKVTNDLKALGFGMPGLRQEIATV